VDALGDLEPEGQGRLFLIFGKEIDPCQQFRAIVLLADAGVMNAKCAAAIELGVKTVFGRGFEILGFEFFRYRFSNVSV
jgi:hypothetical protein